MNQAMLPDSLEEITLEGLLEGESVYVVPWAMWADKHGLLWLNGNYSFCSECFGTSRMKVTKTKGQYIVDIKKCKDEKWNRRTPNFVGESIPIPVNKLIK